MPAILVNGGIKGHKIRYTSIAKTLLKNQFQRRVQNSGGLEIAQETYFS